MEGFVMVIWGVTAVGGAALYIRWLRHGGEAEDAMRPSEAGVGLPPANRSGLRSALVAPHALLGVLGLLLWTVAALVDEDDQLASARWLALATLAAGVTVGVRMFASWRRHRHESAPDRSLPAPMVYGHGLLAAVTVIGAVAAAVAG
jgi:manganese efflux pump family protein